MKEIDSIAILDCGGQYTKVIDRKVREVNVKSDIFPLSTKANKLKNYKGIILSGGPESVWSETSLAYDPEIFTLGIPILGICYGMHLLNIHFGGKVKPGIKNEYGETIIKVNTDCILFDNIEECQTVLMSHGDSVKELAPNFKVCALSDLVVAAMYNSKRNLYGVQFHPEVDLTISGKKIMSNFLKKICKLSGNYILDDRIQTAILRIRNQVKNNKVLVLVSGGVDSAVSAILLLKAIDPEKVVCIHIDHGFMRKNESEIICKSLKKMGINNLIHVCAKDLFLNTVVQIGEKRFGPIKNITDPEEKRNIIGHLFIKVLEQEIEKLNLDYNSTFIAQGTLRPDLIESGNPLVSSYAHKIKTHHNDVELVRKAREKGLVIETNWDWHKDEVRSVARKLGIDEEIASRQPFPGPGLAIRLICSEGNSNVCEEEQNKLKEILNISESDLTGTIIPIRTVGVQGDCRSYKYIAFLSGNIDYSDWDKLYRLGTEIPNKLNFINRVAYVVNKNIEKDKISCFKTNLSKENLDLLREIDYIVRKYLDKGIISQVFAVLLPVGIKKHYSVAIRTFITNDYMTGRPAKIGKEISLNTISNIIKEIENNFNEIDLIVYDITGKPPATVEWE